jgi:hypothetical protein
MVHRPEDIPERKPLQIFSRLPQNRGMSNVIDTELRAPKAIDDF